MEPSTNPQIPWSEADSRHFIEVGRIHIPSRSEIQQTILDLLPVEAAEPFLFVELGVGSGWLSEAILQRYPGARMLGLDASPTMLQETGARLQPFSGRFQLRRFRLQDPSWLTDIGNNVRCFVSSLVIHHLDAAGKQTLYRDLYQHLEAPGGVLIADLVAPRSEWEHRAMAEWWDAEVKRQSLAFTGSLDVYQQFLADHSNWFRYPDPVDMPSSVPEHLAWLTQAGFLGADVFWARAGHALYGAYKLPIPSQAP
jgi:tRNA (cmo5U34)-methyltransferase